ncbi:hypothetical protein LCGC14_0517070 [marine sediment metagenome]|uniref:HTH cro/C1-type domain-containing protein n=1 Tax=marine sediment metagenome TaxID=412755 RepID=A0A0F9V7V3_9ZZZZ
MLSSIKLGIADKLKDRGYRHRFFRGHAQDEVASRIKELREFRKLRQTDLAERCDMKQSAVSRIEQASYSRWNIDTLWRLAEALDVRMRITFEPMESVVLGQFENNMIHEQDYGGKAERAGITSLTKQVHNRYLTPKLKRSILLEWDRTKATPSPPSDLAGRGWPDSEIIPLCDALNALPGVCTLQSCAGHKRESRFICGHLWIVLDESMSRKFDQKAFELSSQANIDRLCKIYSSWGQEIVSIEFLGKERGLLQASMGTILQFFESL